MKILQINITRNSGSTGKILDRIHEIAIDEGHQSYALTCNCNGKIPQNTYVMHKGPLIWIMRWILFVSRITGLNGYRFKRKTKKALKWIDSIKPDVIHLHNIHGDWLNVEQLFAYVREQQIPLVWTIHDCWSFTGRCSYFDKYGCEKWKTGCRKCVDYKVYPTTYFFDFSKKMHKDKKRMFTGLKNVSLAVPSFWLKGIVEQSFMGEYPVQVVHNGIDINVFWPDPEPFFEEYQNKFIILGVANSWSDRKGLSDFIKLDKLIDHNKFRIVLVGLNDRQLSVLPPTITGMKKTDTQDDLRRLYSQAGCLANMSMQETFGMTTIEAMACGTPVVAYNRTAVPEPVTEQTGIVVKNNTPDEVYSAIQTIAQGGFFSEDCRRRVLDMYDYRKVFHKYIDMYHNAVHEC